MIEDHQDMDQYLEKRNSVNLKEKLGSPNQKQRQNSSKLRVNLRDTDINSGDVVLTAS